jgi:hypothetical protein
MHMSGNGKIGQNSKNFFRTDHLLNADLSGLGVYGNARLFRPLCLRIHLILLAQAHAAQVHGGN